MRVVTATVAGGMSTGEAGYSAGNSAEAIVELSTAVEAGT